MTATRTETGSGFTPAPSPLKYFPGVEQPEPDEDATTIGILAALRSISETTYMNGGHALRSMHAKSHALLRGEIEILDGLPSVLSQGLFATSAHYPVAMRFSTIPGDLLDDNVSVPRGLALKIIGVPGQRIPGSEGDMTQDFVLVNGPAFAAPTGKAFLKNLQLLARTTDKAEGLKKVMSSTLQGLERLVETFGGKSPTLIGLGGHTETNVLGESYYSQTPVLYGEYIAKLAIIPVSAELSALTHSPVNLDGKPNGLRQTSVDFFRTHSGLWQLRVQLCTELETNPVEDSSVPWPEDKAPYVTVARIKIPVQDAWNEALSRQIDDGMAFSPWHGLAAHRPLGSIMRIRKSAYEMSAQFRFERNGCPMAEPRIGNALDG